jgi:AraC-like DNA-binding protein
LRVANLLKSRAQLSQFYGAEVSGTEPPTMVDPSVLAEREFVDKAKKIVQQHLLDNKFDIPAFCKSMGMSRTQLHRKLTAITGHSASNFINLIRLEKAKELLLHSDQSISDIAYATGFTDPSYFSRTFSKFQNCNPSEFRLKKGLKL